MAVTTITAFGDRWAWNAAFGRGSKIAAPTSRRLRYGLAELGHARYLREMSGGPASGASSIPLSPLRQDKSKVDNLVCQLCDCAYPPFSGTMCTLRPNNVYVLCTLSWRENEQESRCPRSLPILLAIAELDPARRLRRQAPGLTMGASGAGTFSARNPQTRLPRRPGQPQQLVAIRLAVRECGLHLD